MKRSICIFMALILIGLLIVPGCQGRSIRPDDETLPIPTGNTTATEPADETNFGGTQPEASVSPSDETEPTTPLEPVLLSVPARACPGKGGPRKSGHSRSLHAPSVSDRGTPWPDARCGAPRCAACSAA